MSNRSERAESTRVAQAAGVDRVTAWRWLTGKARPSRLALGRLDQVGILLHLPPPRKRKR
jgi:hypothetical protein